MEAQISPENNGLPLPEGWVKTKIGDVVDLNPPRPPKDLLPSEAEVSFVPMPAVDAQSGTIASPERRPFSTVRKGYTAFRDGDVIFAKITPCMENGKAAIAGHMINGLGFGSTEFHVLRASASVISEYVFYYVRQESFRRAAEAEMTGSVGQKRVPADFIRNSEFPLPPLPEQKRIVAKLEELLPMVNAVRERLIRVKEIMKRFRQSVLSGACSGLLTADWRTMRPNVQKAGELVKEAQLKEKRLYAEECEKAKRNGKGKPRRPSILELEETDSHPDIESWAALRMDYAFRPEGLFDGPFGSNLKTSDYTQRGVRVVRIENIGFLSFLEEKRTYVSAQKYETLKKHTVGEGDLIFASFISEGVRAVVLPKVEKAIAKADCFCLRPLQQLLDSRYLAIILSSRQAYSELIKGIHGATRPRITTKQLRNLNIPLAPLEEQREIGDRVESLFKIADKIEKRVEVELSRTEKMTQAILAKAFRGELVSTEADLDRWEGEIER